MDKVILKKDMIRRLQNETGLKKLDIINVVKGVFNIVEEALADGDSVHITGFGTFKTAERRPKTVKSVVNGEEIHISGKVIPTFIASRRLKQIVMRNKS